MPRVHPFVLTALVAGVALSPVCAAQGVYQARSSYADPIATEALSYAPFLQHAPPAGGRRGRVDYHYAKPPRPRAWSGFSQNAQLASPDGEEDDSDRRDLPLSGAGSPFGPGSYHQPRMPSGFRALQDEQDRIARQHERWVKRQP